MPGRPQLPPAAAPHFTPPHSAALGPRRAVAHPKLAGRARASGTRNRHQEGEARWTRASRGSCPGYCRGLHIATFKTGRLKTAPALASRAANWRVLCPPQGSARSSPLGVWLQKARSGPRRHRAPSCPRGRKPSAPEMSGTTVGSGGRRPTPRRLTGEGRKGQPCSP